MSSLLLVLYFVLLSFFLVKVKWVRNSGIRNYIVITLFGIKVIAGFALVYLYGHYYNPKQSDIYIYFNDATYLKELFLNDKRVFWNIIFSHNLESPVIFEKYSQLQYWSSSSIDFFVHEKRIVILVNFVFSFIAMGNIYIYSLLMAFIGFLGQLAIFRFVKRQTNIPPIYILLVSFLLPTFLLWSSSILKEPLIIFSLGFALFFLGKWTKKWNAKYFLAFVLFYLMGLFIKPYVILALSFPIIVFVLLKFQSKWSLKKQAVIIFSSSILILILFWVGSFVGFNVFEKLANKQIAFYDTIAQAEQISEVESEIAINKLEPTLASFLINTPKAFANVMFKPGIYDFRNLLYLPDIFQNMLILFLGLWILLKTRQPNKSELPFLWLSILFILILFSIIGLVTPILGAIVRYKIPALIFVFFFLLSFIRINLGNQKVLNFLFHSSK